MPGLTEVVAFLAVTDLDRAADFYGTTLGIELQDERPFALRATVGGTQLRITAVESLIPAPYTLLGFNVADITAAIDELVDCGITFTHYDGMGQDEHEIWTSPTGALVAWFLDPDGNNLSLTQHPAR